jgi:hypothetical protein
MENIGNYQPPTNLALTMRNDNGSGGSLQVIQFVANQQGGA